MNTMIVPSPQRVTTSETSAHQGYLATRTFGSLDGLRCLSILAVIWFHAGEGYWQLPLLARGYLGVSLFFVISGFLITTLLLRERDRTNDISLSKFYMRRSLRIFPLFYATLLLYLLAVVALEKDPLAKAGFFANLPYYASYTSNWFVLPFVEQGTRTIFLLAWSLAAEEQFYLLWPALEKYGRGRLSIIAAGLLMGLDLFATSFGRNAGYEVSRDHFAMWQIILESIPTPICCGVLLAHALHPPRGFAICHKLFGSSWSTIFFAAIAILASVAWPSEAVKGSAGWPMSVFYDLAIGISYTGFLATCVVREDHLLAPLLKFRPIAWVGTVSYGVYLLHMLGMNVARKVLEKLDITHPAAIAALTLVIACIAAAISFRFFEAWFLRFKQRYSV